MTIAAGSHRLKAGGSQIPGEDDGTTAWWWIRTVFSWGLLLAAAGLLAAMVVVPKLAGATPYTVLTGSMEPTMPPGTLVVVKPTPPEDLQAGDVITFQPYSGDPQVVTHRIEGIFFNSQGERRFYTKGDANPAQDSWALQPEQIRGRAWYSVPYLGRINSILSGNTRATVTYVLGGGLAVYAVWMVGSGLVERRRGADKDIRDLSDSGIDASAGPSETTETK